MSKIVQAVNAMISNPEKIGRVVRGEEEFFFLYNNKYKWSMAQRDGGYALWFYPGNETLDDLAVSEQSGDWDNTPMVTYSTTEIGTKEAKSSFSELYTLLKEKVYGVNAALDDIIANSDLF